MNTRERKNERTKERKNDRTIERKNERNNVSQESIASEFFEKQICPKDEECWNKYKYFDFHIIVPKFISLGKY